MGSKHFQPRKTAGERVGRSGNGDKYVARVISYPDR